MSLFSEVRGEVVWHVSRNLSAKLKNILTSRVYEGHPFIIKDAAKVEKTHPCVHCRARFTKFCNLLRHAQRCAQGKTVINCLGKRVEESNK